MADEHTTSPPADRPLALNLLKLARPAQWSKSAFVVVGPAYGLRDIMIHNGGLDWGAVIPVLISVAIAAMAFSLTSSGCYVVNDIADREADRAHPRKCRRPIASGQVAVGTARIYALVLFAVAASFIFLIPAPARWWVGAAILLYVINTISYSAVLKHHVIADVMSLSFGFVLRVMAGCAAAAIEPSVWLLNVTFFLSMFLAFGKRLGERRTLARVEAETAEAGTRAVAHRKVQGRYTDVLLQMAVVVTAVTTLMTYALYVQSEGDAFVRGFNLLWLTILPATYGMLRCIVLLEEGVYDDPTELAVHDRGFQLAGLAFVAFTGGLMLWRLAEAGVPVG